jgi:PAT family beta-lactamase induction signal transducer AmpG
MGFRVGEALCGVSLFYLPWVLKVWWKPFVDTTLTYRHWILTTQFLLSLTFALLAFSLSVRWLMWLLLIGLSWLTAMHNVAADGFARLRPLASHHSVVQELFRKFSMVVGQGMLLVLVGNIQVFYRRDMLYSWRVLFYLLAGFYLFLLIWHVWMLPRRRTAHHEEQEQAPLIIYHTCLSSIVFLLCYAFAQGMVAKVSVLFLMDTYSNGGLGLSPQEFGFVMGLVGITALTVGGLLGTKTIARFGFSRCLWPMTVVMLIPCGVYVALSYWQPRELFVVASSVLVEQLAYGFGFALYLSFLKHTAHREKGKSLMALSLLLGCLISGPLLQLMGYNAFFVTALIVSVLTLLASCSLLLYPQSTLE